MAKRKTDPFLRGMGGKDDFIAEQFVLSEDYKAQQMAMVQKLIAAGLDPEQVARRFSVPFDLLPAEERKGL
jgi:hypothetical protein